MADYPIQQILEDAEIEWRGPSAKMLCSQCDHKAVTCTRDGLFAKCWSCEATWSVRGGDGKCASVQSDDPVAYVMGQLAKFYLGAMRDEYRLITQRGLGGPAMPPTPAAITWLTQTRHLPNRADWLTAHDVGMHRPYPSLGSDLSYADILAEDRAVRLRSTLSILPRKTKAEREALSAQGDRISQIVAADTAALELLKTELSSLVRGDSLAGAVAYIYRDESGAVTSINFRRVADELAGNARFVRRLQPRPGRRGVFGALGAMYDPWASYTTWGSDHDRLIIVEGEHNLLRLHAVRETWGHGSSLHAIAVGGKTGSDRKAIEGMAERIGGGATIIYDNDDIDAYTSKPGGYSLVTYLSETGYYKATTTPKGVKDLDDWLGRSPSPTAEDFRRLAFVGGTPCAPPIEYVASHVRFLLRAKLEANDRQLQLGELIYNDLKRRGRMAQTNGYASVMLPDPEGDGPPTLYSVRHRDEQFVELLRSYGLTEPKWVDAVGSRINGAMSHPSAPHQTIHPLSLYRGGNLYLNCYDGRMIRISRSGTMCILPNGSDEVWMRQYSAAHRSTGAVQTWFDSKALAAASKEDTVWGLHTREGDLLDQFILGTVSYAGDAKVYKQLLKAWLLSLFFAADHHSRPAVMFEGPGGSGKSTIAQLVGNLLLGKNFSVQNSPSTAGAVGEKMSSSPYVVFDEWESASKEVENAFRTILTGGKDERRELYTTSKIVQLPCDAAVMLTTNASPIRAAATTRRFITIPVAPCKTGNGDAAYSSIGTSLLPAFMAARPRLWAELVLDLRECVINLEESDPHTKTTYSMADFGAWVERLATVEGWGAEAAQMFASLERSQEDQVANNLLLANLLTECFAAAPDMIGAELTAERWCEVLSTYIPDSDRDAKAKLSRYHFGRVIQLHEDLFRDRFGLIITQDNHSHRRIYRFKPSRVEVVGEPVLDVHQASRFLASLPYAMANGRMECRSPEEAAHYQKVVAGLRSEARRRSEQRRSAKSK